MKIIITESQYERLLVDLSPALKRRLTDEDLNTIERLVLKNIKHCSYPYYADHFDFFVDDIIYQTLHEFVAEYKSDEIDTEYDEEWGEVWIEDSKEKIFDLYWPLFANIKSLYTDKLHDIWKDIFKK